MISVVNSLPAVDQHSHFRKHIASILVSSLVEEGLAKIFNFHVLRHGTCLPYYLDIIKNGADPSHGGKTTEAFFSTSKYVADVDSKVKEEMVKDCKRRFFVFKDVLAFKSVNKILAIFSDIFLTRTHAVLSASGYVQKHEHKNKLVKAAHKTAHVIAALFTPRVRFMYRQEEIEKMFKEDPDYKPLALYTEEKLPSARIGLTGILNNATMEDFNKTSSLQKIYGIGQVVLGVGLTLCGLGAIT